MVGPRTRSYDDFEKFSQRKSPSLFRTLIDDVVLVTAATVGQSKSLFYLLKLAESWPKVVIHHLGLIS